MAKINAITYNPKTKIIIKKIHPNENDIFRILNLDDTNYIYMKKEVKLF